jgi:hypothetical protein
MLDILGGINIIEKVLKWGGTLWRRHKKNPSHYLGGELSSGLDIAYRIIALFEAHDVKRTQIYRLLGDRFPEITPSLDVEKLKSLLDGDLFDRVCELFGVRKSWVEGDIGPIYTPVPLYKNFSEFVVFVRNLKARNLGSHCFFTALKARGPSNDLYVDAPDIAIYFSELIADLDGKQIYRHHPILGPFPWKHRPTRYHLCAFLNVVDRTDHFSVKGYFAPPNHIAKVSAGEVIPLYQVKASVGWHPENYGYPFGHTIGRLELGDWRGTLEYLGESEEFGFLNSNFAVKVFEETPGAGAK